jgi:hypothetical protein
MLTHPDTVSATLFLRKMMKRLTRCSDLYARPIICTPIGGCYGKISAWVVTVEGTPPRGTLFIGQSRYIPDDVFFIDQDRCRRLGMNDAEIVREFEAAILIPNASTKEAHVVVIPGMPADQSGNDRA